MLLPLFLISLVLIGVGLHYRSITSIPPHLPQAQPVAPDQVEPQSEPLVQELDLIGDSPDADSLATAEEVLSKGFKVFTEIASSHPERLMRHLLSFRQGLIVVEDASGLFFLQQGLARKKIVVDGALASEVDIRDTSQLLDGITERNSRLAETLPRCSSGQRRYRILSDAPHFLNQRLWLVYQSIFLLTPVLPLLPSPSLQMDCFKSL